MVIEVILYMAVPTGMLIFGRPIEIYDWTHYCYEGEVYL
jgi:hypothetical protein